MYEAFDLFTSTKMYIASQDRIKLNHKCLFYASNTKIPGITALSICSKEGFPDFNAWDPAHPYYDAKSNEADPTWYMVELRFVSHLPHLVSLKLLQFLASLETPPECLEYLTQAHLDGIKVSYFLLPLSRLSFLPSSFFRVLANYIEVLAVVVSETDRRFGELEKTENGIIKSRQTLSSADRRRSLRRYRTTGNKRRLRGNDE